MPNFSFLQSKPEYALFAPACIEAEKIFATAPALCAVGCRKALELAVKWVYAADKTMKMPYRDNLQSLVHEPSFRFAVDYDTWGKFQFIIKLGNDSVHTGTHVRKSDALFSLRALFEFVQWIDYCYGSDYQERTFDEELIPTEKVVVDTQKSKSRKACWRKKRHRLRRFASKSRRWPLNTQHKKSSARKSAPFMQSQLRNSPPASDLLMWTSA